MRSKKVERAIKETEMGVACAEDYTNVDPTTITNVATTAFCPFINHARRGYMHRQYPTGMEPPNNKYHWWQLKDYSSVQFCKFQRDGDTAFEKCEKHFKTCSIYKEHIKKK